MTANKRSLLGIFFVSTALAASSSAYGGSVSAIWKSATEEKTLQAWNLDQLATLKTLSSMEKDPETGKVIRWKGAMLSDLIDKSIAALPPEQKAAIDLIVLRGEGGEQALVPRSVITKYPVLLAFQKEGQRLGGAESVVPWTSKSKILAEDLPLESYFIPKISRIEFTNYRDRYQALFLKRRTDPAAMRGEKLYVQNCVSCHASGMVEAKARTLASSGHPAMKGISWHLNDRDKRYLVSYLDAFKNENGSGSGAIQAVAADAASPQFLPRTR